MYNKGIENTPHFVPVSRIGMGRALGDPFKPRKSMPKLVSGCYTIICNLPISVNVVAYIF